jgi:hypothetical protein
MNASNSFFQAKKRIGSLFTGGYRFLSLKGGSHPSLTPEELNSKIASWSIKQGACLMSRVNFQLHVAKRNRLGRDPDSENPGGTQWITSLRDSMQVLEESQGNVELLCRRLGLPQDTALQNTMLCIINRVAHWGLSNPTQHTPGANAQFLPGGRTIGGLPEKVIDQIPTDMAMVDSSGDFFVQRYVIAVPVTDYVEMKRRVAMACLSLEQVTSTPPYEDRFRNSLPRE